MKPTVVLLHGLMRSARSMAGLARAIETAGYATSMCGYASRRRSIEQSAADVAEQLVSAWADQPLVLVTHSLGGILARYLAGPVGERAGLRIAGIVMLAPPNAGSRLARHLVPRRWFRQLYGPAAQQLGGEPQWPVPSVPIAVIAGTRTSGLNPARWLARALRLVGPDEPSDGTVLVEETRLPGMVDFATVEANHTFIMDHPEVREMVLHFLDKGTLRGATRYDPQG